jgi:transcriptional regulator with XRE-family HTH domain
MEINAIIASRIKELRNKKNIKASTMAGYLTIAESTYSNIENGKSGISAEIVFFIAMYFEVKVSYFYKDLPLVTPPQKKMMV